MLPGTTGPGMLVTTDIHWNLFTRIVRNKQYSFWMWPGVSPSQNRYPMHFVHFNNQHRNPYVKVGIQCKQGNFASMPISSTNTSWSHGKDSTLAIHSACLASLLCHKVNFLSSKSMTFQHPANSSFRYTNTSSFMKHSTKFLKIGSSVLYQVVQSCKLPKVVLVNALYGLGQVLVWLYYEYHHCYLTKWCKRVSKWCTRQTKWCAPLQKGLARTLIGSGGFPIPVLSAVAHDGSHVSTDLGLFHWFHLTCLLKPGEHSKTNLLFWPQSGYCGCSQAVVVKFLLWYYKLIALGNRNNLTWFILQL